MWDYATMGTDIYHIIHWFIVYCFLGWLVESIYMSYENGKLTNRGFMRGPFCPIYGFGALTVYFILRPFAGNYIKLYFLGLILATTLEYFTAKLMLRLFGEFWWDYNNKPFNYKGILCLESSLAWGLYTVCLFGFLHKFVIKIVSMYSINTGKIIASVIIFVGLVDFLSSLFKALSTAKRSKGILIDGIEDIEESDETEEVLTTYNGR